MGTSDRDYSQRYAAAINAQLRAEIAAHGTTSGRIADTLGYGRSSLQRWLRGEREMPVAVLIQIADLIGLPPQTIIERAEERLNDAAEEPAYPHLRAVERLAADQSERDDEPDLP